MNNKICCICDKKNSSYKCPQCKSLYCSVDCCKSHKLKCLNQSIHNNQSNEQRINNSSNNQLDLIDDRTQLLSDNQKLKLKESKWLSGALTNKRLREHIKLIDESNDRKKSLKQFKDNNDEFNLFMYQLLDEIKE